LRTHPGVLLGYSFWRREFGGDPGIVGRQITLLRERINAVKLTYGACYRRNFVETENGEDRDLWMPAETWPQSPIPRN